MGKDKLWKAFVDMDIIACNLVDELEAFGSKNAKQYRKDIATIEKEVKKNSNKRV